MAPKISIIVPVYNVEKYLPKCLNSLINQTYKDIEIILVDDGSKDNSLTICRDYASKDNRITVLTQKNQGPSIARNNALKAATGEYIGFVDSDDYIAENAYEKAIQYMTEDIDLVVWDVNVFSQDNLPYVEWFQDNYFKLRFHEKIIMTESVRFLTAVVPWNKLYKKSIIDDNGIIFPEGKLYEDNAFWWKYTMFCRNAYFLDEKLSYYNMRATSLRGEVIHKKDEKEADRIYMVEDVYNFCYSRSLLTESNKKLIENLFTDSFINAYKESLNKDIVVLKAKQLLTKINFGASKNKVFNNLVKELTAKNIQPEKEEKRYNLSNKSQYIKEIKKSVQRAKSGIGELKDLRIAAESIEHATKLAKQFANQYFEKQSLGKEMDFLRDFYTILPNCPEIEFTQQNLDIVLNFLKELYENNLGDEVIKFASIMQTVFPQCFEFDRIKGDAYWFLKKDGVKAFYFYNLYCQTIKDNASVYKVMAKICAHHGDMFNELFYSQLALRTK